MKIITEWPLFPALFHPGETAADTLGDRGSIQIELAPRTGVSPAYISNVIVGNDKSIPTKFDKKYTNDLINEIKNIMREMKTNIQRDLKNVTEI